MSVVATPFTVTDNTGAGVSGASITIGGAAVTLGPSVNGTFQGKKLADGTALAAAVVVNVVDLGDGDYVLLADPEGANGEIHFTLGASKSGVTIVPATFGVNVTKDSSRIANDLDAVMSSRLATSGYTAPDNADIATILTDVVALLGRTDPTTAITAIKAVTDHLATALQADGSGGYQFTTLALVHAPTSGGGTVTDSSVQADVAAALAAAPGGAGASGSILALLTAVGTNLTAMASTLTSLLSAVNGIPAALLATTIDGTLTFKQMLDIQESIATGKYVNTPSVNGGPQVTTYYRADATTVVATDTVTFSAGQPIGRTVAFTSP